MRGYLAIDFGSSSCRASTISEQGRLISQSKVPVRIQAHPPAFAEIDADYVWNQVRKVVRQEVARNPGLTIAAVGASAMVGYVFLDGWNRPLLPAIIWMDNRARGEIVRILEIVPEKELYRRTRRRITPELLAPKILWLAKNRQADYRSVRRIIGLKDEIVRRLTGTVQTDFAHLDYSLLHNVSDGAIDRVLLQKLGIQASLLPAGKASTEIAGQIPRDVAEMLGLAEGTPVIVGSSDGTTAMYAGGVLEKGNAVLVSGTTDTLMMATRAAILDPTRTLTVNTGMVPGIYLAGGAMGLSGGALSWASRILRTRIENLQDKIRGLAPEAEGLLLFPGLTGERSPYWKDYFSGSLVGVTAGTKPEHILRALMEGTSLRLRKLLSVMKGSGLAPARITIVGGCSQIDVWNQIKADVTGIDIVKSSISEATSLGTAMFCRVALGEARSLREAARAWAAEDERYRPNSSYAKVYAGKAALFDEYIAAADGVFRKLQARPQAAGPRLQE